MTPLNFRRAFEAIVVVLITFAVMIFLMQPARSHDGFAGQWVDGPMGLELRKRRFHNVSQRFTRAPYARRHGHYRPRVVTHLPPLCYGMRRVVGEEGNSRSNAVTLVKRRWLHEVGHDYGKRYGNVDRARDAHMSCNPTTITRYLKKALWTCVIVGKPCRAEEGEKLSGKEYEGDNVEVRDLEKD